MTERVRITLDLISRAKKGDKRASRALFGILTTWIMDKEPVPELLASYFLPAFLKIEKGEDEVALEMLNLAPCSGRPKEIPDKDWDFVIAVHTYIIDNKSTRLEQVYVDLGELWGLSPSRVKLRYLAAMKGFPAEDIPEEVRYLSKKGRKPKIMPKK